MRLTTIAMGAVVACVLGGGALAVAGHARAQEGGDATQSTRRERRDAFKARVAEKLGISSEALEQAVTDARLGMVDEALANGRISEEQAARMRQRIESGEPRARTHPGAQLLLARVRAGLVESAAAAIGATPEELRSELKAGKSVADVAGERGAALDDVKARIAADAKAKLDERVAAGKIDQARADELQAKLSERLDAALNKRRTTPGQ